MRWDLFCKVIDNYGDIGVCWRLAADLAGRGEQVRLWVDDPSPLAWLAPQGHPGVTVRPWQAGSCDTAETADVVIEAFGCELDEHYLEALAPKAGLSSPAQWINLEYLSAEDFVMRNHGLQSPVLAGPAKGLSKRFFYPGFTDGTGGLLRERDLRVRIAEFDRGAWLADNVPEASATEKLVSLFCYEPPALAELLEQIARGPDATRLLLTAGRATVAASTAIARLDIQQPGWNALHLLRTSPLPFLSQRDFDHLLWSCDFNFVRGEDSLVRAIWAGKPFAWQIYPQHDGAHERKLEAFLTVVDAPDSLRDFHRAWNGLEGGRLPALDDQAWGAWARQASGHLAQYEDLTSQLLRFVSEKG